MEVKLFGVNIVDLYNYNLDKAYNFVKDAVFFSDICFNVDDATYAVAPT